MPGYSKRLTEVELAYQILCQARQEMYFRELIGRILAARGNPGASLAQAMSEIHTQINMDSRFVYHGKGMWGLADWIPQRGGKAYAHIIAARMAAQYEDDGLHDEEYQELM